MLYKYLLTIGIPTYNGSKTIGKMLEVLIPQCTEDVQILISDNASTDNTYEVVEKYLLKYPFIKYLKNKKNIGPDSNFLQCMEMAEGKYTLLLSDDDILMENSLNNIIDLIKKNTEISLIYINAKGFHSEYIDTEHCEFFNRAIYDNKSFVTKDKKIFMDYAGRMWGFLSCFICLTDAFNAIEGVEQFKKTNWLQSYIHILCSEFGDKNLGVISVPCVGAGIYSIITNFDSGRVDGLCYQDMLNFAIKYGFNDRQLRELFIWRICFLAKRNVIKERAAGLKKTSIKNLFKATWKYPIIWLKLYPVLFCPPLICKGIVRINNHIKGYTVKAILNREGDVIG